MLEMSKQYISQAMDHAGKDECWGDRNLWEKILFDNNHVSMDVDNTPAWPAKVKVAVRWLLFDPLALNLCAFVYFYACVCTSVWVGGSLLASFFFVLGFAC